MAKTTVTLKTGTGKEKATKNREFSEKDALTLLNLSGSKWELADTAYSYNGKELSKASKANTSDKDAKAEK